MFDLKTFKRGRHYIHLPTQDIYNEVMMFLKNNGVRWVSGKDLVKYNNWEVCRNETSIRFNKLSDGIEFSTERWWRKGPKKCKKMDIRGGIKC